MHMYLTMINNNYTYGYVQSNGKFSRGSIFVHRTIFNAFQIQFTWTHVIMSLYACTDVLNFTGIIFTDF